MEVGDEGWLRIGGGGGVRKEVEVDVLVT